ncbi:5'-AMP-activated protein kinase, beta-1 subunit isoform 1 [Galdieria sulphuraria]|nr:5'-AMP-activated protein kinase, beta-1 subunit isoform 1 [Galdieria sulphuraria]EME30709.1 5'-AMP-activated protein kinase, beta-1 subunit isoform 1 [Galdieria sulphuraria]|eukprot:XP_005707229.1 5'-AMP-activated protein kinase, beta-1 subunit isoform 1 [Galdieria sulphuraria]
MSRLQQGEDEVWRATKSLPAGVYQYKFIVDNVWRCAPEQPCVKDERGILNNIIHVTFKECDDKYCFCHTRTHVANSRWTCEDRNYSNLVSTALLSRNTTGIVLRYEELPPSSPNERPRSYMHRVVDDKPFEVTVLNLADGFPSSPYRNISRVSSIDEISSQKIDSGLMLSDFSAHNPSSSSNWENRTPKSSRDIVEAAAGNPLSIAISLRAKLSHPRFGFNPRDTHPDIILTDSNYCATKTSAALYRTCRTTFALAPDMNYYFEIYVAKHEGKGTCVGLSTKELPLNCLCGTRPNSVGFYTTGHLIRTVDGKPQWVKYGTETEADSIVGVFVRLQRNQVGSTACFSIFLDGVLQDPSLGHHHYHFNGSFEVFPTVTLYSQGSKVYGLFCSDHIHHFTVLEHLSEPVYGLDGRNIRIRRESSSESLHNELSMDLLDI